MKKYVSRIIFSFLAGIFFCPMLWCNSAKADATGCLALEVSVIDVQTEEYVNDENFYSSLKATVSENGKYVRDVKGFDSLSYFSRARGIIGEDYSPSWETNLIIGNRYDVEIMLPENYELKSYKDDNTDCCTVSGRTLSFVYDETMHEKVKSLGAGMTISLVFYNGPKPKEPEIPQKLTTEIKVPKKSYKIISGTESFLLKATVKNGTDLSWHSSDNSVIQVSQKGMITAKKPGRATVTISSPATDKYTGSAVNISFIVRPKKVTSVKTVNMKTGKVRVTWEKSKAVSGYHIMISTNKKFTKNTKTYEVKSAGIISKTIDGLKKGIFYVKVCAYKTDAEGKIEGVYSNIKEIKIK